MKIITLVLSIIVLTLFSSPHLNTTEQEQAVNPILSDISFFNKFGYQPNETTDEGLRIKTHLEFVENLLRQKDVTGLPPDLLQKRSHLLDLLHNYWLAGIFPHNYDYKESREPCFIDKDNRICAVGYLIEKTIGRQTTEVINTKHKYDRILAMNDKMVDSWIKSSGLSKEECAMIQPTYGPVPTYTYNYIKPAYGISSSVLGGINLSLNTLNGIQISKGTNNKNIAIAGLIAGAGQTILGATMFPKTRYDLYGKSTNESQKTLSMINIGLGTSTLILSTWNLIANKKPREKKMTWNLNSFETVDNKIGMAITINRKF